MFVVQHIVLAGGRVVGRHRGHRDQMAVGRLRHRLARIQRLAATHRHHHVDAGVRGLRAQLRDQFGRQVAFDDQGRQRYTVFSAQGVDSWTQHAMDVAVDDQGGAAPEQGGVLAQGGQGARSL
ncbi:hypothetical protein G6F35_018474 [Rhizopus arrhizus]|nr:hypothetical protein G6F35_018474 [Rhizopus arrhizus]